MQSINNELQTHINEYITWTLDKELKLLENKGVVINNALIQKLKYISTQNDLEIFCEIKKIVDTNKNRLDILRKELDEELIKTIRFVAKSLEQEFNNIIQEVLFFTLVDVVKNSEILKMEFTKEEGNVIYTIFLNYINALKKSNGTRKLLFNSNKEEDLIELFSLFPILFKRGIQEDLKKINVPFFLFSINKLNEGFNIEDIDYTNFQIEDNFRLETLDNNDNFFNKIITKIKTTVSSN